MDRFYTEHLVAERLCASDLDGLCRMHRDAAVMATLGGVRSDGQSREYLVRNLDHWTKHGFGICVLRDKTDGRFVGRAGLRHVHVAGQDEVELAYALLAEFWGRGLATEISRALLALGFDSLGLANIVAFTLPTNLASRRVMEKLGLVYEREVMWAERPHVLYRITATKHSK